MNTVTVWTKQHKDVLRELEQTGRYSAKRQYIIADLAEHAPLMLEAYDWLVKNSPQHDQKPADVEYPVWVSLQQDATMMLSPDTVILELALDPALITRVNIEKWGTILNYSYIPANPQDAQAHRQLLELYGISDAQAYLSQFYPEIKRKIIASWSRLFDDSILFDSDSCYGIIWEVKKEWLVQVIK